MNKEICELGRIKNVKKFRKY